MCLEILLTARKQTKQGRTYLPERVRAPPGRSAPTGAKQASANARDLRSRTVKGAC